MTDLQLWIFVTVLGACWAVVGVTFVRWIATTERSNRARRDLWIVPSDHVTSAVRAVKDSGPYDWAADALIVQMPIRIADDEALR